MVLVPVSVEKHNGPLLLVQSNFVEFLQRACPHGDDVTQLALREEIVAAIFLDSWPVAEKSEPSCGSVWHTNLLVELGDELLNCRHGREPDFLCVCVCVLFACACVRVKGREGNILVIYS